MTAPVLGKKKNPLSRPRDLALSAEAVALVTSAFQITPRRPTPHRSTLHAKHNIRMGLRPAWYLPIRVAAAVAVHLSTLSPTPIARPRTRGARQSSESPWLAQGRCTDSALGNDLDGPWTFADRTFFTILHDRNDPHGPA